MSLSFPLSVPVAVIVVVALAVTRQKNRRSFPWLLVAGLGLLVATATLDLVLAETRFVGAVDAAMSDLVHPSWGWWLRLLTSTGGTAFILAITVTTAILLWRHRNRSDLAIFLGVVVAGEIALVNGLKSLVGRARPQLTALAEVALDSFPSGHATAAASVYAALVFALGTASGRGTSPMAAATAVAVAVAVAATRILLGVHWVTDVVAGLALGWAWFAICRSVFERRTYQRRHVTIG